MINIILKDIRLAINNKSMFLFLALFVPFVIFINTDNVALAYLSSVLVFTYMFISIPFQYEMKNKTHILIKSLPGKSFTIVAGRYVYALISFLFSLIFTYIYFKIISVFIFPNERIFSIDILKQASLIIVSAMSIILLIHFTSNSKIANFLSIFSYAFFFSFLSPMSYAMVSSKLLKNYSLLISILIPLVFLLSLTLSNYIYNKRNFS